MYAETGALMRNELAALLHAHRTQHRLHAGDLNTADVREHGMQVRQYRQTILAWTAQAVRAAKPLVFSPTAPAPANPFRTSVDRGPVNELARALDHARLHSSAPLASLELLTTPSNSPLVEHWRHAARGAALAEHDTNGPALASQLTAAQAEALAGDIAAISQALIVLDQRYTSTPGWERLAQPQRLGWAALATALDVSLGRPDYSVDRAGWRPRAKVMRGPAKPGVLGVLQAEHNLLVRLQTFPNAMNLRLIIDSQRLISAQLAPFASRIDEALGHRWSERAATYRLMQIQLRNVGGSLGKGGLAVADAVTAVSRMKSLSEHNVIEPRVLAAFQTLFTGIDDRVANIIEQGVSRGAFVQRTTTAKLADSSDRLIVPAQERFAVVTKASDLAVIGTVRDRLRPRHVKAANRMAEPSRAALHAALLPRSATRTNDQNLSR